MKFKAELLKPVIQETKDRILSENRPTKWGIKRVDNRHEQIIAFIPDWFLSSESVAKAIAEILNRERKIQLNLEI